MSEQLPESGLAKQPEFEPRPRGPIGYLFLDPTRRLRIAWRFLLYAIAVIVAYLVAGITLFISALSLVVIRGGELEEAGEQLMDPSSAALAASAWLVLVPLLIVTLGFRQWIDRRPAWTVGLNRSRRPAGHWALGLVIGCLLILLPTAVAWALGGFRFNKFVWQIDVLWLMPSLVLAAFEEELLVRGYLLRNFLDLKRPVLGIVLTSLLFAALHAFNPSFDSIWITINLVGAGVLLGLAYMYSDNLWYPTALHFGWNFTQGVLLGIPVSGIPFEGLADFDPVKETPAWISGGAFGLEGSAITTVVTVAAIAGYVFCLRRAKR